MPCILAPSAVIGGALGALIPLALLALLACRSPAGDDDSGRDTGTPWAEDPIAEADVVVIGSGAGGLGAAWAARDAGASVLVVEREPSVGGATRYAANYWAAGTHFQADAGVTDSPEAAAAEWASFTGGDGDAPAVQRFVTESAGVLDWLEGYGATFTFNDHMYTDIGSTPRIHVLSADVHPVDRIAEDLGDAVWTSTTAVELVTSGGAVVGVRVAGSDGTDEGWIRAGAVVVATGGFTRNDVRVASAVPGIDAFPTFYESNPGMDGNGLDLGESVGAALQNLENTGLYAHGVEDASVGAPEVMVVDGLEQALIVDASGRRVADEWAFGSVVMGRRYLDEGPFYAFFDDDVWRGLTLAGRGFNYQDHPEMMRLTGPEYESKRTVARSDDPVALATSLGIDGDGFAASFEAYAEATSTGTDAQYGKLAEMLAPLDTPPYRAVPLVLGRAKSFGGLATDDDGEVVDGAGDPIPGLYAAGEATGFLGGAWTGQGLNGSITAAWWSGLRAGGSAATAAR